MNFEDQMYTIARVKLEDGSSCPEVIEGVVAGSTGLGYHYMLDERGDEIYVPDHIPSGYSMGPRFYYEDDVKAYIEKIAPMADWQNLTARSVYELPADLKAQIKQAQLDVCDGQVKYRISKRSKDLNKFLCEQSREKAGLEA